MWKPGQCVTLHIGKYLLRCRVVKRQRAIKYSNMIILFNGKLPSDCLLKLINQTDIGK